MKTLLTSVGLVVAGVVSAATLTINLSVSHGTGAEDSKSRKVAYFVVDRSGSMDDATLPGNRTPNDALLESLRMRLDALPDGASVYVIPFASVIKDTRPFQKLDKRTRNEIYEFVRGVAPKGQTLLYDAEDLALTEAAGMMQRDPLADVSVYVYTDGLHLTPYNYEGPYQARSQLLKARRFVANPDYVTERAAAEKRFHDKFKDVIAKPNLELEYEWLSSSPPPVPDMPTMPRIGTELRLSNRSKALKNPRVAPNQVIEGQWFLPISDRCWEEVKGKPFTLDFEVGGKHASAGLKLENGKIDCRLDWPMLPSDSPEKARLLFLRLPGGRKFELKAPNGALEWVVPPVKGLSVEVASPARGEVVPLESVANGAAFKGTIVRFAAKPSEPADVKWVIDGGKFTGSPIDYEVKKPGMVNYSVTASKTDFRDAPPVVGTLEAIPVGVEIVKSSGRHEVGKESVFQAKAVGPYQQYAWTVDGVRVPGEAATLKHVFGKSGEHTIGVTVMYRAGITRNASVKCMVAAAPMVQILEPIPYDGDVENAQFQADRPISFAARVEGELTMVTWQFKLKDQILATLATEVRNGRADGKAEKLPKGGYYDLVATARGPAGEKSATVPIFVKSAEARVDITEPTANKTVETGKELVLSATTKGAVKSVRWRIIDLATMQPVTFGLSDTSAVVEHKTSITATLPLELGNANVKIQAEPIFDDKDKDLAETVQPSEVTVNVKTIAGIEYTPETKAQNWKPVKYGDPVALAATPVGQVQKVAWFTLDADGNEKKLDGEGSTINVKVPECKGRRECHIDYFARVLMPDKKTWLDTPMRERVTVVGCCPCSLQKPDEKPRLVIRAGGQDNVNDVGISEDVRFTVENAALLDETSVRWVLDGTNEVGKAKFSVEKPKLFSVPGHHVILMTTRCKTCECEVSECKEFDVILKPVQADFTVTPSCRWLGDWTSRPFGSITLRYTGSGDVAEFVWKRNGREIEGTRKLREIKVTPTIWRGVENFSVAVKGVDGSEDAMGPKPASVTNIWLFILLMVLAAGVGGVAIWYWSGDEPRFWKVRSCFDDDSDGGTQPQNLNYYSGGSVSLDRSYPDRQAHKQRNIWNVALNRGKFPLWLLSRDWKGNSFGDYMIEIWASQLTAAEKRAGRKPRPMMSLEGGALASLDQDGIYATLKILDENYRESDPEHVKRSCLRLFVDTSREGDHSFFWFKLLAVFVSVGVAMLLGMKYAF